jgi:hypothetical protein
MQRDSVVKKVTAELEMLHFPAAVEQSIGAHCLSCSLPLSLSQPDLDTPSRLLGVCEHCKHWFFIELIPEQTEGVLWRLPDIETIRHLSIDDSSGPIAKKRQRRGDR